LYYSSYFRVLTRKPPPTFSIVCPYIWKWCVRTKFDYNIMSTAIPAYFGRLLSFSLPLGTGWMDAISASSYYSSTSISHSDWLQIWFIHSFFASCSVFYVDCGPSILLFVVHSNIIILLRGRSDWTIFIVVIRRWMVLYIVQAYGIESSSSSSSCMCMYMYMCICMS